MNSLAANQRHSAHSELFRIINRYDSGLDNKDGRERHYFLHDLVIVRRTE